ncbi:MAG: helix-turn-helix transcriptional regulator [Candidatus Fimivicinus sp.]|nr:helix-turn-helix transcriptional regulator [Clostridiales bacterium]MCI6400724.1 helix-turn-helix domain-containing protein [Oscillospiraceae bacterium]MDY5590037.1 helix-turn-helix transcriptional regulator [Candidatus Fimivicinus sp.]
MEKHADKYRQLAINIAYYRKKANLTQIKLAEKAGISRTHMSNIEAPNVPTVFTTTVLFDIADALSVELADLFDFNK